MQINMNNTPTPAPNNPGRGKVVVSTHPIRHRTFIDRDGNEVSSLNPRTRQIIKKADEPNK